MMVDRNGTRHRLLRQGIRLAAILLLVGSSGLAPRAFAQAKDAQAEPAAKPEKSGPLIIGDDTIDPNQPIKPEFTISVSVVGEPEPSGTYTVDPAGNVSIKYAGVVSTIPLRGLTPKMAEGEIAKVLKAYVKNPQVTVTIVSVPRPTIFLNGALKVTGPIYITQDATLVDVLTRAQWTDNADLSQVRITRTEKVNGKDEKTVQIVNFEDYIRIKTGQVPDEKNNPVLKDKDRILVGYKTTPGTGVVSIGGEVTKPQQNIPLRNIPPMTVRELINLVGGTTGNANRKAIAIRRPTVDRPLIIDLDKAEQGDLVNNIELRPDDAIYVEKLENNAYINLNGGFVKTGKYVFDKRTTLTQAIMDAGGPAPFSKLKEGRVIRHPDNDPKNTQVIVFNWKEINDGKAPDIDLQPGDSIWLTPGAPSGPRPDIFSYLNAATSAVFLYNNLSGRYFGGVR